MGSIFTRKSALLPWLIALSLLLAIEITIYLIVRPNEVERGDFLVFPIKRNLELPYQRWLIWEKFRSDYVAQPSIVHVGDSSGLFGLMPDVAEQYLPGQKILNLSCCANQGFHGYLAALEFALRKYPSIRYIVVNMAPVVYPQPGQWHGAGDLPGMGLPVMGDDMARNFVAPGRLFYPPSNYFRWQISRWILRVGKWPGRLEQIQLYGFLRERGGYAIEMDRQTAPQNCNLAVPKTADGTSYLETFVDAFAGLAKRYDVVPVLQFHPTACQGAEQHAAFDAEIARLSPLYPALRVPYTIAETWPANFFSVPAHVQRGIAIETSRRFGRAMRDILRADNRLPPPRTIEHVAPAPAVLRIWKAGSKQVCDFSKEFMKPGEDDLTPSFAAQCNHQTRCSLPIERAPDQSGASKSCQRHYEVTYQCSGEPVRTIREEDASLFGGVFALDCDQTSILRRDPTPYGLQVLAVVAGDTGEVQGRATLRARSRCDGLFDCPLTLPASAIDRPRGGAPASVAIDYVCDRETSQRRMTGHANGEMLRLSCTHSHPTAQSRP